MRTFAVIALLGVLCACSSGKNTNAQSSAAPATSGAMAEGSATKVKLHQSNTTFNAADAACAGSLGSIVITLGHVRAHAAKGVDLQTKESPTTGITTFIFADKASGKTATVVANGHDGTVSTANVSVRMANAVACVGAE